MSKFIREEIVIIKPKSFIWGQYNYKKESESWNIIFGMDFNSIENYLINKGYRSTDSLLSEESYNFKNVKKFKAKILLCGKHNRYIVVNRKTKKLFHMSNDHNEIIKL